MMSGRTKKFAEELDRLISEGGELLNAIQHECHPTEFMNEVEKTLNKEKAKKFIAELPSFNEGYQQWYSEAQEVIKQTLPGRLNDFNSYFEYPKTRKEITYQNYMIRDCLQGYRRTNWEGEIIVDKSAAIPEFAQQLNIVKAAKTALESSLMDLKAVLQADLFDSEIESASALAKAGYLRAAGAICGVVIEKHLVHTCDIHKIGVKKKNPTLSDLSQLLRDNNITTVPQWRFIQHLADIRNICDHAKGREPTKEEIGDLVTGSEKVLKTVF
ncbi:hypothetical protein QMT40_002201 [Parvibaculaceae bacterium PLY_AMNH_Bact1]|nr:hypothetical protein QMT40_002201 [Parvibaculaceae bacterium PLY_AMNH_Bact1]